MQEFRAHIRGLQYPVRRDDLVRTAKDQGAPEKILDQLRRLPDRPYRTEDEVHYAVEGTRDLGDRELRTPDSGRA